MDRLDQIAAAHDGVFSVSFNGSAVAKPWAIFLHVGPVCVMGYGKDFADALAEAISKRNDQVPTPEIAAERALRDARYQLQRAEEFAAEHGVAA